jgi:hypothetical protein
MESFVFRIWSCVVRDFDTKAYELTQEHLLFDIERACH